MSGEIDHADAVADQRRDLVAQRLAAAGRHEHQRVAAADHVLDDLLLVAAERVVAEDPAQHLRRVVRQLSSPANHAPDPTTPPSPARPTVHLPPAWRRGPSRRRSWSYTRDLEIKPRA